MSKTTLGLVGQVGRKRIQLYPQCARIIEQMQRYSWSREGEDAGDRDAIDVHAEEIRHDRIGEG